ncbi:hypothetical protein SUGI_0946550 [Cryptomeria japonica]|uniref:protein CURLY FLAG LEAF 2 n=1 Tax=Cryptomeria japonica TaxID=3369 RepID=UPI002414AF26|nr:protein CURLY FLAG LEAF 2 [Cryptomeria japonica]GLJ44966.1 hypothetical protein SUGI_0946550 [Cryptomeria japonica]
MGRGRMATPGTCCALEHCFKALSINHGSLSPSQASIKEEACFHAKDDITIQRHNQNSSHKDPLEPESMSDLSPQREQFLDLKTGELHFYDSSARRRTKSHSKKLLRMSEKVLVSEDMTPNSPGIVKPSSPFYYSESEDFDSTDEESSGSERSQKEASEMHQVCEREEEAGSSSQDTTVLVAAGCQSCLMYYMLPKHAMSCPKCGTSLLHFNEPATSKDK